MKYALPLFLLLSGIVAGCGSSKEAGQAQERRPSRPAPVEDGWHLSPPVSDVRTIQFYLTGDERRLPILPLRSGETLTLAFDLLHNDRGKPLSVYFYHANRSWRRDLTPSEYLDAFQRDDLLDYQPSHSTDVPYTHYTYRFPNQNIDFLISGNYIIRVTEQGMEEDVLFERAFFVSEQAASVDFGLDNVMVGGNSYPSLQPTARFTPPATIQANAFNFNVCFVRNGQFAGARCTDRPSLARQPALEFYLQPETAFEPQVADYFVDVGRIRVGGRIERTDRTVQPYQVFLEPDYARFAGTGFDPLLNGQIVVEAAVTDVPQPGLAAEYVDVYFAYVPPDEQPLRGDVVLSGSFNDWRVDPAYRMEWVAERGRYEGKVLLKQGQYEYRYVVSDRRVRRALTGASPRLENLFTVLVYFSDLHLNTDRLVAVNNVLTR